MATLEQKQGGPTQAPLRGAAWDTADDDNPAETYPPSRSTDAATLAPITGEGWRRMIRKRIKART